MIEAEREPGARERRGVMLRRVWDALLAAAGLGAIALIGPKIAAQARAWPGGEGAGRGGPAMWVLAEGVGLLVAVLLMLSALGTWHIRPAPRWVRAVYAAAGLAFAGGAGWQMASQWRSYGMVLWGDAAVVIGWYVVMTGPVVCFGVGWPGVVSRVWGRVRAG